MVKTHLFFLFALILLHGCTTKIPGPQHYLTPIRDDISHVSGDEEDANVYEKEKGGIRVAVMAAMGRENLLVLSVAVLNESSRSITVSPQRVFLAVRQGFLIRPKHG